jgi:hypothetical protein
VADEAALNKGWKKCNKRLLNLSRGASLDFLGETHEPIRFFFSSRASGFPLLEGRKLMGEELNHPGYLVTVDADVLKEVFASEEISKRGAPCSLSSTGEKVQGKWTTSQGFLLVRGKTFCSR